MNFHYSGKSTNSCVNRLLSKDFSKSEEKEVFIELGPREKGRGRMIESVLAVTVWKG